MYISKTRHLLYITDIDHRGPSGRMEHLSCFFPGLITLGLHILPDSVYKSADEKLLFQHAAEGLAHTCWVLYADQATGVGPDEVVFEPYNSDESDSDEWESGRWINHVNEWLDEGKPEGKLKGVHNLSPPRRGNLDLPLDYRYKRPEYFMRPEVCLIRSTAVSVLVLTLWTDHRVGVPDVEDHWKLDMARTRVGDVRKCAKVQHSTGRRDGFDQGCP